MPESIVVRIEPASLQVKPAAQASARLTVRNRTEEVVNFVLTAEGTAPGWISINPEQVAAFPMQDVAATVTVQVPADAVGAVYHVTVRAADQGDATLAGTALLDLDVPATFATPATPARPLPPESIHSSSGASPTAPRPAPPPVPESHVRPPFAAPPPPPPVMPSGTAAPSQGPRAQSAAQIEVVAEQVKDSKLPPPAVQWKLSLRNAGAVLDTFAFSIAGIKPAWVRLQPAQVTLNPDERGAALLTVTPPPDTQAGTFAFVLRTFSHLNLNQRTDLPLKVEVSTTAGFQAAIDPREAEAQGQRDFRVVLTSSLASNSDLWINLAASDQDNASEYVFEQAQVFLPAKQAVAVTLRVRPRAVLGPNERKTMTFRVTATDRDGKAPPQVAEARLTQVAAAPLRLVLRPQSNSGEVEANFTLLAVNPSGVESSLVFSGEDPELGCEYAFQPSRLTLPAGAEAQVALRVHARSNFESEGAKDYAFTISATRVGEMVPIATTQGKFTQTQLKPIRLALIPPQQSSTGAARFVLKASNPRPKTVQVLLSATDEADALAFSLSPPEINLAPGSEGSATITAHPKDNLMKGEQRRVHKFVVTAQAEGSAVPPTVQGTLAQIPGVDLSGFSGPGVKLVIWVVRWLVFLIVLFFLATLALAAVEVIQGSNRNANLSNFLKSLLNPIFVDQLLDISPFGGLGREIARALNRFVTEVLFP